MIIGENHGKLHVKDKEWPLTVGLYKSNVNAIPNFHSKIGEHIKSSIIITRYREMSDWQITKW